MIFTVSFSVHLTTMCQPEFKFSTQFGNVLPDYSIIFPVHRRRGPSGGRGGNHPGALSVDRYGRVVWQWGGSCFVLFCLFKSDEYNLTASFRSSAMFCTKCSLIIRASVRISSSLPRSVILLYSLNRYLWWIRVKTVLFILFVCRTIMFLK